ncbi:MAG: serine/threonine-protein kinase, partial [Acidobacteriota bacterium]|nr:serine/threonine-protein kinase [Acidobacteriota bacterium]
MTPERYQRIKQIFQAAVDRPPAERPAWLEEACADDAELRREIESLLADADEVETKPLLDSLALPALPNLSLLEPRLGQFIGPYKILRELGHGGMGTVYLAERTDGFKQRVALKVVKRGMDSEEILSRFRHERQILASLNHSNIARLLDGGTTEDGLPYFVMEHIEGVAIDDYCRTHKLTTVERLQLFRTVCAAVHYAHQNLVVHRDIKPSNILVTAAAGDQGGTVKLLDFGIAKILNPELFPETVLPTRTWERPMTPAYASPEQVRGQQITTASDVYSLGVVLYELLTGQRPYQFKGTAPHEIAQVVCETEPARPSTAVIRGPTVPKQAPTTAQESAAQDQAARLSKQLKGDLDNIVLMALRKEAQRRYASVEQFSEDIRRHLEGRPVSAREDTLAYRADKFVRRNKAAVVAASVVIVLLLGFLVTLLVQSARVTRERDRAQRERDKAERVSSFLVNLFKVSDPSESRGNTVTAREVLDKGAEQIRAELQDQPDVRATLLDSMGQVYGSLGLYDKAGALLEEAVRSKREIYGAEHAELAVSLHHLGAVKFDQGDYAPAGEHLRSALQMRRKLLGAEHPAVAETLNSLGQLLGKQAKYKESEAALRESLEMRRKLLGNQHRDTAESIHNYGWVLLQLGDYANCERYLREALAIHRQLFGNDHLLVAANLNTLGFAREQLGSMEETEAIWREALEIRRRVHGTNHPEVAESLNNVAYAANQRGDIATSEALYRESLAIKRQVYGSNSGDVARSLANLGRVLMQQERFAEAEPILQESLALTRRIDGAEHPSTARAIHNLAALFYEKGEYASAEPLFRQALALRRQKLPPGHIDTSTSLTGLGLLLTTRRQTAEAEPMLREAVEIRRKNFPGSDWRIAESESVLGECLLVQRRFAEAEPLLIGGYELLKAKRGEREPRTRQARARLVKLYQAWSKPERAAQYRAQPAT